jgi:hypothetical protein
MQKSRRKLFWFGALAIIFGGLFVGCDMIAPRGTWRYKMTVEVETPEGVKTGSAVREVSASSTYYVPLPIPGRPFDVSVKGEALVVDLGERGQVFALLRSERTSSAAYEVVFNTFPPFGKERYGGGGMMPDAIRYYRGLAPTSAKEVPLHVQPMMVMFRDMNDPTSVEKIYSGGLCEGNAHQSQPCVKTDRFAELFGEGVRLKSVTLEMTERNVTWGKVARWKPKFERAEEFMEWYNSLPYGNELKLGPDAFSQGAKK